jgi:preprotein translocase subunit SecE
MDEDKKLVQAEVTEKNEKHEAKSKEKKRSFVAKLGDYRGEYRKIIWPTRQDLIKETVVVVVTCLIVGAIITGFDMIFANGYSAIINFFA